MSGSEGVSPELRAATNDVRFGALAQRLGPEVGQHQADTMVGKRVLMFEEFVAVAPGRYETHLLLQERVDRAA